MARPGGPACRESLPPAGLEDCSMSRSQVPSVAVAPSFAVPTPPEAALTAAARARGRCASASSRPIRRAPAASGRSRATCARRCSRADGVSAVDVVGDRPRRRRDQAARGRHPHPPGPARRLRRGRPRARAPRRRRRGRSSTSTASSAAPTARTSCRSPTELRLPMVVTLHTVLSAPSVAPGRDAARAVRSRDAGVRVHRDGAADDRRRAAACRPSASASCRTAARRELLPRAAAGRQRRAARLRRPPSASD